MWNRHAKNKQLQQKCQQQEAEIDRLKSKMQKMADEVGMCVEYLMWDRQAKNKELRQKCQQQEAEIDRLKSKMQKMADEVGGNIKWWLLVKFLLILWQELGDE